MQKAVLSVQDVLESQMGMQLSQMKQFGELDPEQQVQSVLPGSHPPVKGFYLIKPSPIISSSRSLHRSNSLLTRLRLPKCPSSAHSIQPSSSMSELGSLPDQPETEEVDHSFHSSREPEAAAANSLDAVVDIDQIEQSRH